MLPFLPLFFPRVLLQNRHCFVSGNGKLVATASDDRTAILWDAVTGKKLKTFQGHAGEVKGVALSGDGKYIVTASLDGTAMIWETAGGKMIQILREHGDGVNGVAMSRDGNLVVTGSED